MRKFSGFKFIAIALFAFVIVGTMSVSAAGKNLFDGFKPTFDVNVKASSQHSTNNAVKAFLYENDNTMWRSGGSLNTPGVMYPATQGQKGVLYLAVDLGKEETFGSVSFTVPMAFETLSGGVIESFEIAYTSKDSIWTGLPAASGTAMSTYDLTGAGWTTATVIDCPVTGNEPGVTTPSTFRADTGVDIAADFKAVTGRYVIFVLNLRYTDRHPGDIGLVNLKLYESDGSTTTASAEASTQSTSATSSVASSTTKSSTTTSPTTGDNTMIILFAGMAIAGCAFVVLKKRGLVK